MKAIINISLLAILFILCGYDSYSNEMIKDSIAEKQLSKIDSIYKSKQIDKIYPEIIDFQNYLRANKLDSYMGRAYEYGQPFNQSNND